MAEVAKAVDAVKASKRSFCKFLSANDTGETGAHQCGIYISKPAVPILFDKPGKKGTNKERFADIKWMDGTVTQSRFIYYGQGTRNEYRITRFGHGFPYLKPDFIGSLFVLTENQDGSYSAFIFDQDEDIQDFLDSIGISATETNNLIELAPGSIDSVNDEIMRAIQGFPGFPDSKTMSQTARDIFRKTHPSQIAPDQEIIDWTDVEYQLYRALEDKIYKPQIIGGFSSVDDFETLAAQLMNRRKSRAGKSLENHLEAIFNDYGLDFEPQVVTEGNKTSDFVFPSSAAYHDPAFPVEKIVTLGAKTTCKDWWRQVLNEADRVRNRQKFLCTLQQGISESQLDEMDDEKLTLVVPKKFISAFPASHQAKIWSLERFINYVKQLESK